MDGAQGKEALLLDAAAGLFNAGATLAGDEKEDALFLKLTASVEVEIVKHLHSASADHVA